MRIFYRKPRTHPRRVLQDWMPIIGRRRVIGILDSILKNVERQGAVPLLLWVLPVAVLVPLGLLWLLKTGLFWPWAGMLVLCAGAASWLNAWMEEQGRGHVEPRRTPPARIPLQVQQSLRPIETAPAEEPVPTSPPSMPRPLHTSPCPLRILFLGCSSSGKSTLIGALFGRLRAAIDLTPDPNRALTPYRLERDGQELAIVYDTPGSERLAYKSLHEVANAADIILWVSAAHSPERHSERQILDALRTAQTSRVDRRPPPMLVVVTHIDRLRPLREWQPPYDLTDPGDLKAMSIQAAVTAFAADFEVPIASVIPVCLAEGRIYNVDDTLWAAILEQMDRAQRTRLMLGWDDTRRDENWTLLRRQLANAGRFMTRFPGRGHPRS
ncbi:GTPase family protein [Imhoffiella purpurea]|nr:GTPase domain-containing protein [Imhoffiella purpurea]